MKIYKYLFWYMFALAFLSIATVIGLNFCCGKWIELTKDILIGLFASAIILFVNSIIGYIISKKSSCRKLIVDVKNLDKEFRCFKKGKGIATDRNGILQIDSEIDKKETNIHIRDMRELLGIVYDSFSQIDFLLCSCSTKQFYSDFKKAWEVTKKDMNNFFLEIEKANTGYWKIKTDYKGKTDAEAYYDYFTKFNLEQLLTISFDLYYKVFPKEKELQNNG